MIISESHASFRPKARLVSILGEQMISDHVVGLLELVKNAYDADASQVRVTLKHLESVDSTVIEVEDDGFGMRASDVVDRFLSPADDHKAQSKSKQNRTPKGRLPIGEKGVGRFAVHQLGHRLQLITRAADANEVFVDVNWDAFDNSELYLSDLTVSVIEREPEVFIQGRTGTQLVISKARTQWTDAAVRKIQRGLRRLQSPHVEQSANGLQDFRIIFRCDEYPLYESLDPGDILDRSHYQFQAVIYETGMLEYEYVARHPGADHRECEGHLDLMPSASDELSDSSPKCGPFYINLYVWDRTAQYLQSCGVNRADLDAMAGVSLFRDHLRVLPYGEPGDDWLRLDRDRINNPSERIGNNQVIGFVEVFQSETPGLKDKTNREGLIENEAFRDLRALTRAAIAFFNTLWAQNRPAQKSNAISDGADPANRLHAARSVATAIHESARTDVAVQLSAATVSAGNAGNSEGASANDTGSCQETVNQKEASKRLVAEISHAITADQARESAEEEKRDVLLHLAATGMAAERVVHEVGRQAVAALAAMDRIKRGGEMAAEAVAVLEACLGTLRNEFRALAPYEGINRLQRSVEVDVRESLDIALALNTHAIREKRVTATIVGDSFSVLARPASLIQSFDNIIHNACFWVRTEGADIEPRIDIKVSAEDRSIDISDTGPGVPPEIAPVIFRPFATTRLGGRGLGLYVTRELLQAAGGTICLIADEDGDRTQGATFRVDLSGCNTPDERSAALEEE